jgi:hypothetical protein
MLATFLATVSFWAGWGMILLVGAVVIYLLLGVFTGSQTMSVTVAVTAGGNSLTPRTFTATSDQLVQQTVALAANTTNQPVTIAFKVATLATIYVYCDATDGSTVTLKTNSTSVPGNTITFKNGEAFVWDSNMGITNPFTVDVTEWYLTNTTACNVFIVFLHGALA